MAAIQQATTSKSVFDPAGLEVLQKAFEQAWAEFSTDPVIRTDEQPAPEMIGRRIADAAVDQGIRDPAQLKAYTLRLLRKPV